MNTKGIKFLAVLAVLAMAFAVFAVATDVDADATITEPKWTEAQGPLDFSYTISGSEYTDNVDMKNNIYVSYDASAKKYTVTGTMAYYANTGDDPLAKLGMPADTHYGLAFLVKADESKAYKVKIGNVGAQSGVLTADDPSMLSFKDKGTTTVVITSETSKYAGTYTIDFSSVTLTASDGSNPTFGNVGIPNTNALLGLTSDSWDGAKGVGAKGTWTATKVSEQYVLTLTGYEGSEFFVMPINAALTLKVSGTNKIVTDTRCAVAGYGITAGGGKGLTIEPIANGDALTVTNPGVYGIVGEPLTIGGTATDKKLSLTVTAGAQGMYSAYSGGAGLKIQNATVTVSAGERGINAHNDSKLDIVKSTITANMTGSGKTNQDGDNDNWGVKTKVLVIDDSSTLTTQGLRVTSGGSITNNGKIIVSGDYVASDKVSPSIAGLYYEVGTIIEAYEYQPEAASYIQLKDGAQTFGLVTVHKSTTDDDKEVVPSSEITTDDSIKEKINTNAEKETALAIDAGAATKIKGVTVEKANVEFIGTGSPTITGMDVTIVNKSGESKEVSFMGFTSISGTVTTSDGSKTQTMTFKEVKGNFTIRQGSIYIDGKIQGGTIELDKGVEVKMSGSVDTADVTIKMKTAGETAKVIIEEDQTITIDTHALIIEAGVTLEVYGKITNKSGSNGILTANKTGDVSGVIIVMPGGAICKTGANTMTVNGTAKSNVAYSGSDINSAAITAASWSGKDLLGGKWSVTTSDTAPNPHTLKLNNYNGTYNFASFAAGIMDIEITGDNKITYAVPEGYAATSLFGGSGVGDSQVKSISTSSNGSLEIDVDYSKASYEAIKGANIIIYGDATFSLDKVSITITATGANEAWTDTKEIKLTAISYGATKFKMYDATLTIDAFSAYTAKAENVYAVKSTGAGAIDISTSEIDIDSAGDGIKTTGAATFTGSEVSIDAKETALDTGAADITFTLSPVVNIKAKNGINTTGGLAITDCLAFNVEASKVAINAAGAGENIDVKKSILAVKGDVKSSVGDGLVTSNSAVVVIDGLLDINKFDIKTESVVTVKDLRVTTAGTVTVGTLTTTGKAIINPGATLTNEDKLNNTGVMAIYGTFTNNGTVSDTGAFTIYAKTNAAFTADNDDITVAKTVTDADKVNVTKIELSEAAGDCYLNADGTLHVKAIVSFQNKDGDVIVTDASKTFEGTLSLSSQLKEYYVLTLANDNATIKLTYAEVTTAGTEIGKSYTIDVAGNVIDKVDNTKLYPLLNNAKDAAVGDEVKTLMTGPGGAFSLAKGKMTSDNAVTAYAGADAATFIKKGATLEGNVVSYTETVAIYGTLKGDLTANGTGLVTIGQADGAGSVTGTISAKGAVTINNKASVKDVVAEGNITVNGKLIGDMTVNANDKKLIVTGEVDGKLTYNSKYKATKDAKDGEETTYTAVMTVKGKGTFTINLAAGANATESEPVIPGYFTFGALEAPATTDSVAITLTEGKLGVPSNVVIPVRYAVTIETGTTIEVVKTATLDVKNSALKVSSGATKNFETGTGVAQNYGKVLCVMTFTIEDGAYTIYSDVAYALINCEENSELTVESSAAINSNVEVKKGVNVIIADKVTLDFATFGLAMDEGSKITLNGTGKITFGITGEDLTDEEDYKYYTINGVIVYDDNTMILSKVRFSVASTISGIAATSTEDSMLKVDLTFNQGIATFYDGYATGKVALKNNEYFLNKEDADAGTNKVLVSALLTIGETAVLEATEITDVGEEASYVEQVLTPSKEASGVLNNGVLRLTKDTTVKGVYSGVGKVVLAEGKKLVIQKAVQPEGAAPAGVDKPYIGAIFTGTVIDTTEDMNGYAMVFVMSKTTDLTITAYKSGSTAYMRIGGEVLKGEIMATTTAVLDALTIDADADLTADAVKIINANSTANGGLATKDLTVDTGKKLIYNATYEFGEYTVYTKFANVNWDVISDVTLTEDLNLGDFLAAGKKLDLSEKDVNIVIADGKKLTVDRIMIIGTPINSLGDEGSSIVGTVELLLNNYLVAYSDVDLSEAKIVDNAGNKAVSSRLDVEDILYATIYARDGNTQDLADADKSLVPEIEGFIFTAWINYNGNLQAKIGDTNAYADAKAVYVTVIVKYVAGVDYYMNGTIFTIYDIPADVPYGSYFTAKISDTTKYQGNPLINGEKTVCVTDDVELVASGVTPIPEPPQPEPEPVVGDSGLSLTDILLIVLVILIAIMVVILVLRLNRS